MHQPCAFHDQFMEQIRDALLGLKDQMRLGIEAVAAPEAVQEVLANMCFNLGLAGPLQFRQTLAYLQAGIYRDAASVS